MCFSIFSTRIACLDTINEGGQMQMGTEGLCYHLYFYVGLSNVLNIVFSGLWKSTNNVLILNL